MFMIITKALYGLKTSAKAWSKFFGKSLKEMRYLSCFTDQNIWMKPAVNKDGYRYLSYMLVYVCDYLAVHTYPGPIMEDLKSCYKLKVNSYEEPEKYFGKNFGKYQLEHDDEKLYWSIHASD